MWHQAEDAHFGVKMWEHFNVAVWEVWKLKLWKSAQGCLTKHMSKAKCKNELFKKGTVRQAPALEQTSCGSKEPSNCGYVVWPRFVTVIAIICHQHTFLCMIYYDISCRLVPPFFRATQSSSHCSPWAPRQLTHGDPTMKPHCETCILYTALPCEQNRRTLVIVGLTWH